MKVVIFAGGLGTRLMEETEARPKPMVEIGGKPILWHIMKMYSEYGFNDFILCLGYKQAMIKEFFINYYSHNSDLTIDLKNNTSTIHNSNTENFNVTLVDTGLMTNTAGRLKRVQKFLGNETFMLTYGDGVSDVNIQKLVEFHKEKKKIATLTAIQMPGRYGNIEMNEDGIIRRFVEKPEGDGVWINGGFMVLEPKIFNYISDDADEVQFEKGPLLKLANENEIASFKHNGFWKCMDALRDKMELEELWNTNQAKWKRWIS